MIRGVFAWADAMPSSVWLRESLNAFPILLTSHVLSMCLFAGLVMMMDFRLAGIGNRSTSIPMLRSACSLISSLVELLRL
ncbi:MAG: hypothetical protein Ct9H300mP25_13410 [Acidobacteriota bacterium]|nr:MAG: hypothetical protein Ct9H300mP25_13410 [Acidobacteriota bacterium]